jgi:hypothetical protein
VKLGGVEMILAYLEKNYSPGEPIFTSDIKIDGITENNKRQQIKHLVDSGKILKFDDGIYYFPKQTRLKGPSMLSAEVVAQYKYIMKNGVRIGYYSGHTLANRLGISNQVPMTEEIVSNNMSAIVREVRVGKRKFIVRKPTVNVTEDNYIILQLLDLLKDIESYSDNGREIARSQIVKYIETNNITREDIDMYIQCFPIKIYKYIYEMRLDHVLA